MGRKAAVGKKACIAMAEGRTPRSFVSQALSCDLWTP